MRTGEEGHWTDVRLYHCGTQGDSPPCARALLTGYTENPTMGASFLGDLHWTSWSEATREALSMMGLHAEGTVNVDSLPLDVLLGCSTADRTVTTMMHPDTCYAVTSCTKGALPGDD